jgi:hypothetical protein
MAMINSEGGIKISATLANFIADTVGGVAGVVTGHPFDTIKVCTLISQHITYHCMYV